MYIIKTQQYWDGFLEPPISNQYFNKECLLNALKHFDYEGGCWQKVEIASESTLLCWERDWNKDFQSETNRLKELINILLNQHEKIKAI